MCLKKGRALIEILLGQGTTVTVLQDSDVGAGIDSLIVDYLKVGAER